MEGGRTRRARRGCRARRLTPCSPPRLQANATGRNDKSLREFLEKHYEEGLDTDSAIKLTVKTLLEVRGCCCCCGAAQRRIALPLPTPQVVDSGSKNIDVVVIDSHKGPHRVRAALLHALPSAALTLGATQMLSEEEVSQVASQVEAEAAEEKKEE